MSTFLILIPTLFVGFILYLFFFWCRLREDYVSEIIFRSGTLMFLASLAGAIVFDLLIAPRFSASSTFNPAGLWFWGGILGFLLSFLFSIKQFKLSFLETLEASGVGFIYILASVFAAFAIIFRDILVAVGFLLLVILLIVFFVLESRYKRFAWYKSGRVGFSGLTTIGLLFLIRVLVAFSLPNMLSFVGRVEIITSGVVAFLLFFAVYNIAELK